MQISPYCNLLKNITLLSSKLLFIRNDIHGMDFEFDLKMLVLHFCHVHIIQKTF
jgi:hypothetical protein